MIFSLAVVIGAYNYPFQASRRIPVIIGIAVFVLATIALINELRTKKKTPGNEQEVPGYNKEIPSDEEAQPSLASYWRTGAWVCGLGLAIYLVGFLVAIPLFIITFLKVNGTGWWRSIIISVVTSGCIYGIFEYLLKFELYRGVFFNL